MGMIHPAAAVKLKFAMEKERKGKKGGVIDIAHRTGSDYRVLELHRSTASCLHRYYTFPSASRTAIAAFLDPFHMRCTDRSMCNQR